MRLLICCCTLLCLSALTLPVAAQTTPLLTRFDATPREGYLGELMATAETRQLAEAPEWQALLHYQRGLFGVKSEVDGPDFFLSDRGKHDPAAELAATLAAFFSSKPWPPTGDTPACRFGARYQWLAKALAFDPARLPTPACPQVDVFRQTVAPDGLTLVFPAGHPNNPSSMFGHTLLRIDKRGQTEATRQLSYALNYAADAQGAGGAEYVVKGIIGGFAGRFSLTPYYAKLRQYADLDSRDVWEYRLKLTPAQLETVLLHAYELAPTYYQYFFFDENCAYHLLALIGLAVPEKNLTEALPHAWVIPVDIVRVLEEKGLVESVRYEPAAKARVRERRARLSTAERGLALDLFRNRRTLQDSLLTSLPIERQAAVLDLVYEHLKLDRTSEDKKLDAKVDARERGVLLARAKLGIASPPLNVPVPAVRPDQGHRTGRVSAGAGSQGGRGYTQLGWRGGYHGQFDPAPGYRPHSNLEIGNLLLRRNTAPEQWRLEQLDIVHMLSLEPRDDTFRTVSWRLRAGYESVLATAERSRGIVSAKTGRGITLALDGEGQSVVYLMGDLELALGPVLDDGYRIGPIISAGLLSQLNPGWRAGLMASATRGLVGEQRLMGEWGVQQSFAMGANAALELKGSRQRALNGDWSNGIGASLNLYF